MVSLLIYHQSLSIKRLCSIFILQVLTRLLDNQYIFTSHWQTGYVVRLIPITSLLLSISILGPYFYPMKVCQNSKAAAGIQSFNKPRQVFSCFSQLTSYSHTATKWIRRELCHIMSIVVEDWPILSLRVAMLARDSIIYFIVIFGLCASMEGLLILTSTICYFLACLTLDIISNVNPTFSFDVST